MTKEKDELLELAMQRGKIIQVSGCENVGIGDWGGGRGGRAGQELLSTFVSSNFNLAAIYVAKQYGIISHIL